MKALTHFRKKLKKPPDMGKPPWSGTGEINTVRAAVLPKVIHTLNTIPTIITMILITEM